MLSGFQLLSSIDQVFADAQRQTDAIDRKVAAFNDRALRLKQEESEAYHLLARVRLGVANDALIARLTRVDESVRAALAERAKVSADLEREVAEIEVVATGLRQKREEKAAVASERQQALIAAEDAARQQLTASEAYQAQAKAAAEAEEIAGRAREKHAQAERDRSLKGAPYETDELFQYLWRRGFGTPAYRAGALARIGDRWVARLIGFDKARADYAILQEIPRRLAQHAEQQAERARAEADKLATLQRDALQSGEAGSLRAELSAAETALEALDAQIEASDSKVSDALARRAGVVRGDDPVLRRAAEVIEQALRHEDLRALREAAAATPMAEDDAAVRRLTEIEAEERQLAESLTQAKQEQGKIRNSLSELESVRRDYRRRGYNRGIFDVASGAFIGSLLAELLRGGLSRDGFWDQIGRHQQPWPGGGGWQLPDFGGRGGGLGGRDAGGGDFGGGDFRTGGGF